MDVECNVDIQFVDNGLFLPISAASIAAAGELPHVPRTRGQLGHRTFFGPCFVHTGVTYANTPHNVTVALSRLFHDKVGVAGLHARQPGALREAFEDSGYSRRVREAVTSALVERASPLEERRHSAHAPHAKKKLRERALDDLQKAGREFGFCDTFMDKPVALNLKKGEFAKPGKPGRIVCDLGTQASIRSGWLVSIVKDVCAQLPDIVPAGRLVYVQSPDRDFLTHTFREMLTDNRFVYHSDDSCLSLVCTDGMLWCNLDISSCDSSNGPEVFRELLQFVPVTHRCEIEELLRQCASPCRVNHTALDYRPVEYFEYSGTTLTTLLNNVSSRCIGEQILRRYELGTRVEMLAYVRRVLDECGWKCTVEVADIPEKIQFLKCSPHLSVDGFYYSTLNLGVMLRCFGQRYGDLPGRGNMEARAVAHNCGLTAGFVHAGETSILHALRRRFPPQGQPVYTNSTRELTGSATPDISDSSIVARYDITLLDLQELINAVDSSGVGDFIDVAASRAILQMDYGL